MFRAGVTSPRRKALLVALGLAMGGCRGAHSALEPAGPYAQEIADLWWLFLGICTMVYVLVIIFLFAATFRRGTRERHEQAERRLAIAVGTAVGTTVVVLFALLFFSTSTGNALARTNGKKPLTIRVTGQQWWWQIIYDDPVPSRQFTSANEIYVPVGRPVNVVLESRDVIHSLWIPNIHGKRDLIPGHTSSYFIQADRPGTFEGQCAEFCGHQHAKMRISLTALPEKDYEVWAAQQRQPAKPPLSAAELRGQVVFMSASCAMCHTISGTPAGGKVAPDLTHVGSRRMLAANSIPNVTGHLAGWIIDPQNAKPGNYMPSNPLPAEDLQALLTYLRSLK